MADPQQSSTCLERYGFADLINQTRFTPVELADYCSLYSVFDRYKTRIDLAMGASMCLTGALGLPNSILTFATFARRSSANNDEDFRGPSFIYHKSMALVEVVLMAIMLQYGVLRSLNFPGGYWTLWWNEQFWGGWMFGDAAKLFVLCTTVLVSSERVVAVWFPARFHSIDRAPVVWSGVVVAGAIGCLHLISIAAVRLVRSESTGEYAGAKTEFGASLTYAAIDLLIYAIKLGSAILIAVMCVAIAVGMIVRQRKAMALSTDARRNWRRVKMACYLQLILATTALIDQAAWVAFKLVDQPYPLVGRLAVQWTQTYEAAVLDLDRMRWRMGFETAQAITGELDHGARLYFYLIFHQVFRESFRKLLGCGGGSNQVMSIQVMSQ